MTFGTIAVAAAGASAGSAAVVVVVIALALVLSTVATQHESRSWLEGPDISDLVRNYRGTKVLAGALEFDLVHTLEWHRQWNEFVLRKVRWWLSLQVIVACSGAVLLLGALAFSPGTNAA